MIRREITTITEVLQIHGFWVVLGVFLYYYLPSFLTLIPLAIGIALMGLTTLFVKKRYSDNLVRVKMLQGFSGLIHAVSFSFIFALLTGKGVRGFFSVAIPVIALIIFFIVSINVAYYKLKIWEASSARRKFLDVSIILALLAFICLHMAVKTNFILRAKAFCIVMILFQCISTTNFSRAREFININKQSKNSQ